MAEAIGRPRATISKEQLTFLLSLQLTCQDISSILGVSISTVQRRGREWGLQRYTLITQNALEDAIRDFKSQFPNVGEAVLKGHLESKGIHVQRAKIREAIWAVSGHHELRPPICRRSYSVPGPNALWHIDRNHQMIRWRLVVHGGIDGFSSNLKCSSNNRSDTVVNAFYKATEECGVPSRVRSDKGVRMYWYGGSWRKLSVKTAGRILPEVVYIIPGLSASGEMCTLQSHQLS